MPVRGITRRWIINCLSVSIVLIMTAITAIRTARAEKNVPPSKKAELYIQTVKGELFTQGIPFFQRLASASEVTVGDAFELDDVLTVVTDAARMYIPMGELIDREKELARLTKEKEACEKEVAIFEKKLANEQFVSRAPARVVDGERAKLAKAKEKLENVLASLAAYQ